MAPLPPFDDRGLLPPGDYPLTFDELRNSHLVAGSGGDWDAEWRRYLVDQCEVMVGQLWEVGIDEIYLNGSFVEDKAHPNDIDGYFVCDLRELASGDLQRRLNALDPYKVWTWDPATRRPYWGYTKKQLPMWHRYRVELYPEYGQLSGIRDIHGVPLLFPSAFRQQRETGHPKGILKIVRGGG